MILQALLLVTKQAEPIKGLLTALGTPNRAGTPNAVDRTADVVLSSTLQSRLQQFYSSLNQTKYPPYQIWQKNTI